ncbi:MAG TPA: DEAD/DEAH box helicase family protein [Bacilli bacterium]|nr:DEAD/DEAH box helicase family protein [Bacilli bacterium]HOQ70604.1 DEAD/DEAH box helicase family protein [Bacilli bacterium]
MIYTLKNYQRDAVDELKGYIELGFRSKNRKEVVFKAPTGSGKTFMAASLFEELAGEHSDINFCILWACPGKGELHKQSHDAVKTYLGGNPVCSLLEEDFFGSRKFIKNKEIVFINWEKLIQKDKGTGAWANNLMKDQEGMNFIDVIDQTKKNGTKVVLVVDESHIGSSAKARIQEFINTIIIPSILLEMSATPLNDHIDVEVNPEDVIKEGMIKEDVIVNEGIKKEDKSLEEKDSELLILEKGFAKREEIVKKYAELNINVNPLVLIQIPNVDEGEAKKLVIKDFLREKGITEANGKLKLWCDNHDPFDKKEIRKNNDITEYLIFKTAVATGWDCPRAHILVKFREGKSETFETQTIGRILRTAEAKSYDDPLLDNAYIFTNIWTFETKQDSYNPNKIKTEWTKMREGYTQLRVWAQTKLISFYRSRQEDYNSADSRFGEYLFKSFMKRMGLTEEDRNNVLFNDPNRLEDAGLKLETNTGDVILEETNLGMENIAEERTITGNAVNVQMSENDVQAQYNAIIRDNLNGLAYVRSKSPINTAIMDVLSTFIKGFPRAEKVKRYMQIVVNNRELFAEVISEATAEFRQMLSVNAGKKGVRYDFKIEESRAYSSETHTTLLGIKSLYNPLFVLKNASGQVNYLEKNFLQYLDTQNVVEWYWENGSELMRINFGISYNNGMNTFQPDFIIKFKDGSVGIFDTKPNDETNLADTTVKNEALRDYLYDINQNRGYDPKVVGGIVCQSGTQFYLFEGRDYHDYNSNHDGWVNFSEFLRKIEDAYDIEKALKKLK